MNGQGRVVQLPGSGCGGRQDENPGPSPELPSSTLPTTHTTSPVSRACLERALKVGGESRAGVDVLSSSSSDSSILGVLLGTHGEQGGGRPGLVAVMGQREGAEKHHKVE